ncbi:tyrosine-type recombinase/integrase [Eubacteriaceae bacterium ES3]|nr:tyrosine-type recombinase/integrase [Eubacteriaceae bacterium ES3]
MKKGWKSTGKKRVGNIEIEKMTYKELVDLYEKECMRKGTSDITFKGYEYASKYFMDFAGKNVKCCDITQELVDDYVIWLADKGIKDTSINSYQYKISPIINYGAKKGYIPNKIEFRKVIEQETTKEIYSNSELEALLKRPANKSFSNYRTWVIINTLISTGIRSKELRELKIKNVDLENNLISLDHTKNRKPRVIPISSTLFVVLNEYLKARNGLPDEPLFCNIFGEPLARTTLQASVTKYCKEHGVSKTSVHLFRHTFITLSVRKGVSPLVLKRITGHKNLTMLNHYYNFDVNDIVNIVDDINPLEDFSIKKKHDFGKYKTR